MRKRKNTALRSDMPVQMTWQRNGAAVPWRYGSSSLHKLNFKHEIQSFARLAARVAPDNARDKTYLARINTLMDEAVF